MGIVRIDSKQTYFSGNSVSWPAVYTSSIGANLTVLNNGKLFVTGGTSKSGNDTNKGALANTFFIEVEPHDPQAVPNAEILLHARLTNGWLDPEATVEGVTYRYTWTSNGNDPVIVRGPKAEMEDILHPGDQGATLDAGETWKVTIAPVNGNGTEGPSIQGSFMIGPGLSVTFNGWIVN